jgi:hypothetical protein
MDALPLRFSAVRALKFFTVAILTALACHTAVAASFATTNFVASAPTDEMARRVANCAEYYRRELAIQWLGAPLPNWYRPCPISVKVGQIGAGGQTTFTFENGEVFGWKMQVQGTLERILDSVIPHEVNHTIFASYFRRPLPRWADEGAATLFEHESEQAIQLELLNQVLHTGRRIPLRNLLAIREYPEDMQDVRTLYAEGFSLAEFLVGSKGEQGRKVYLKFLEDAMQQGWEKAIVRHYGFSTVDELEQHWTQWVIAGSPPLNQADDSLLASSSSPATAMESPADELVIRSQSPLENPPRVAANRVSNALPAISRPLKVRNDQTAVDSQPIRTASALEVQSEAESQANEISEDSRPARPRPSTLQPTAEGIGTHLDQGHYAFPAARGR